MRHFQGRGDQETLRHIARLFADMQIQERTYIAMSAEGLIYHDSDKPRNMVAVITHLYKN